MFAEVIILRLKYYLLQKLWKINLKKNSKAFVPNSN